MNVPLSLCWYRLSGQRVRMGGTGVPRDRGSARAGAGHACEPVEICLPTWMRSLGLTYGAVCGRSVCDGIDPPTCPLRPAAYPTSLGTEDRGECSGLRCPAGPVELGQTSPRQRPWSSVSCIPQHQPLWAPVCRTDSQAPPDRWRRS